MSCPWTSQHMTPSTAIEGSKTFSLALSQKSLAKQSVRAVHLFGTPRTKPLRFNGVYLTFVCTWPWRVPELSMYLISAWTWPWHVPDLGLYQSSAFTWPWRVPYIGVYHSSEFARHLHVPDLGLSMILDLTSEVTASFIFLFLTPYLLFYSISQPSASFW